MHKNISKDDENFKNNVDSLLNFRLDKDSNSDALSFIQDKAFIV